MCFQEKDHLAHQLDMQLSHCEGESPLKHFIHQETMNSKQYRFFRGIFITSGKQVGKYEQNISQCYIGLC